MVKLSWDEHFRAKNLSLEIDGTSEVQSAFAEAPAPITRRRVEQRLVPHAEDLDSVSSTDNFEYSACADILRWNDLKNNCPPRDCVLQLCRCRACALPERVVPLSFKRQNTAAGVRARCWTDVFVFSEKADFSLVLIISLAVDGDMFLRHLNVEKHVPDPRLTGIPDKDDRSKNDRNSGTKDSGERRKVGGGRWSPTGDTTKTQGDRVPYATSKGSNPDETRKEERRARSSQGRIDQER
ncbi:hypothetical protein FB45DRAFT_870995 [Roridomyces roridus]|uniref:Uncharacterized protein n=1 Tax=Roridomyces roridus TaxID=1738132 RepID=A0AAD7FHZ4_9AGAR|nr:hypothetical protein FB45DRAFT_870995 [Roridomyces roridus]